MATAEEIKTRVEAEIEKIRPRLQMDGGDIKLIDVNDGVVKVSLEGACRGCPMSAVTLSMGVERAIKQAVPEVKYVEADNVPKEMMDHFRKMQSDEE